MSDKLAVVQREGARAPVPALWLTTLHWRAPKVMVNVESGDYGVLERRRCGCVWDGLGFREHLHTIRSYEKLTTVVRREPIATRTGKTQFSRAPPWPVGPLGARGQGVRRGRSLGARWRLA
jgi:hypothetical protein